MMPDAYVIWSFEHKAWWGPDRRGYTLRLSEAGRYDKLAAEDIVADANIGALNEQMVPVAVAERFGPPRPPGPGPGVHRWFDD